LWAEPWTAPATNVQLLVTFTPTAITRTLNEIGNIHLTRGDVVPMIEAFQEASRIFLQAGLTTTSVAVSGELYHFGITCPNAAPAA